jgi:predicted DNA-binding transcriptional regulator AlpA
MMVADRWRMVANRSRPPVLGLSKTVLDTSRAPVGDYLSSAINHLPGDGDTVASNGYVQVSQEQVRLGTLMPLWEAREALGVSESTLYRMIDKGVLDRVMVPRHTRVGSSTAWVRRDQVAQLTHPEVKVTVAVPRTDSLPD